MTGPQPAEQWTRIPAASADAGRVVSCDLVFGVDEPADIAFQIAVARSGRINAERLDVTTDGNPLPRPAQLSGPHGGRLHVLRAPRGILSLSYRAELVHPDIETPEGQPIPAADLLTMEQLNFLRPSRYCPSDHVVGLAVAEFGALPPGRPRVEAIVSWIHHRVSYVVGSSAVHDSAEDTLLTGQGVCRDFAHLGITLCRALAIPARFAAVYAPGLDPMDFHAVFEAWIDGGWRVYDATRKVPRSSLVRIATGRDAADAAFADVLRGITTLHSLEVTATVTGNLPIDDHQADVQLY